ncbi:protamine-like protein [Actinia tenebrosa]|uniref:Protamine-like protein n=1 Tax=Actinia tenebrosa TaxID=6105 RepID=A0A6P8IZH7_ACTTE|nr:protamine-like protein [Actinia tenebrosa]
MARAKSRKGSAKRARKVAVTTDMIVKAVEALGSRAGSNYKEIFKYLQNNSNIRASSALAVKVAISRGVKTGALIKRGTFFKVPIAAAAKRPTKRRRRSAKRKGRKTAKKGRGRRARKASVKRITKKSKAKSRRRKGRKARKPRAGTKPRKSKAFTKRSKTRRRTPTKRRVSKARPKSRGKSGRRRR